jgi:uroporphyrinogen-III synthase
MRPAVVLTQPAARATALSAVLGERGIASTPWPMTSIEETPGLDWPALAATLAACRWVLFPSPASIEVTMAALRRHALRWPAAVGIGLIGPGSRDVLDAWSARLEGLAAAPRIEPLAPPHDAEALLARGEFASLAGVGVAVLRRADGREAWLQVLRERGAALHAITVYAARDADPPAGAAGWLAARLAGFVCALPCAGWALGCPALTQHPRIAAALRACGWRRVLRHRPGAAGLVAAIESLDES